MRFVSDFRGLRVCILALSIQVSRKEMTPYAVFHNFYNQWHFFSQILHAHLLNKDTHVDHFLVLNFKVYRVC